MKRKVLAAILALTMVFGLAACGSKGASSDGGSSDSGSGDLIKVGIINNDPNESGYRTANDKDMKEMFTKENGYDSCRLSAQIPGRGRRPGCTAPAPGNIVGLCPGTSDGCGRDL